MSITDLNFPEIEYSRTGLVSVVCQLRFNPLLRIAVGPPVEFQERLRQEFPKLIGEQGLEVAVTVGRMPVPELPGSSGAAPVIWRFKTEDETWTASLATDFLSLETSQYRHFPDFEARLDRIHDAFQEFYPTDHFVRVGLRYINLFKEADFPGGWGQRFNPRLLGVFLDEALGSDVSEMKQAFVLSSDNWRIALRHGIEEDGGYRLDIDHFIEENVRAPEVLTKLREFNNRGYQVFRWSISDTMHEEMEPHEID